MKTIDKRIFGDILLADVIFTDGSDPKLRPVLVLYHNGEDCTILKITSQLILGDTIHLAIDEYNNLRVDSNIDLKKINTFHETLFVKKLGSITQDQKSLVLQYRSKFVSSRN